MTTKAVAIQPGQATKAWIHTVLLDDPASCETPPGQTITLDEWRRQQEEAA